MILGAGVEGGQCSTQRWTGAGEYESQSLLSIPYGDSVLQSAVRGPATVLFRSFCLLILLCSLEGAARLCDKIGGFSSVYDRWLADVAGAFAVHLVGVHDGLHALLHPAHTMAGHTHEVQEEEGGQQKLSPKP